MTEVRTLVTRLTVAWPIWAGGYPEPGEVTNLLRSSEREFKSRIETLGLDIELTSIDWKAGGYLEIENLSGSPGQPNSVLVRIEQIVTASIAEDGKVFLSNVTEALMKVLSEHCQAVIPQVRKGANVFDVKGSSEFVSETSRSPEPSFVDGIADKVGIEAKLSPDAQMLFAAAVSLLPQKAAEREILSSSTLFLAAVEWGRKRTEEFPPPTSLVGLADTVVRIAGEKEYQVLLSEFFGSSPPALQFQLSETDRPQFSVSGNVRASFNALPPDAAATVTADDLVLALLQHVGSADYQGTWFSKRLKTLGLEPSILEMALLPGVTTHAASDLWTIEDKLGYAEYARAIYHFLRDPRTRPPLTISVQAPWGGGKTSLMRMIQNELDPNGIRFERNRRQGPQDNENAFSVQTMLDEIAAITEGRPSDIKLDLGKKGVFPTVWFNAWLYQSSNQVWAGLGEAIIRGLTQRLKPTEREKFLLRLHLARINPDAIRLKVYEAASRKFLDYLRGAFNWLTAAVVLVMAGLIADIDEVLKLGDLQPGWILPGFTLGGLVAAMASYSKALKETKAEPAEFSLKGYLDVPEYSEELGYIHQVTEDLRRVLDLLPTVKGSDDKFRQAPIVLFIDDLDRCSPAKVAEVFEAVNLFIAGEFPNCYVILGMDSEVVAAALEEAHKDVVAHLPAHSRRTALGWRYMDKFVQLPFVIPPIDADAVRAYANHLAARESYAASEAEKRAAKVDSDEVQELTANVGSATGESMGKGLGSRTDEPDNVKRNIANKYNLETANGPDYAQELVTRAINLNFLDRQAEKLTKDSREIETLLDEAHRHFSKNPRELKRLANVYRFYMLLRIARQARKQPVPTQQQLRNYVMLALAWPEVFRWLRRGHTEWETASSGQDVVETRYLLEALEVLAVKHVEQTSGTTGKSESRPPTMEDWTQGLERLSGLSSKSTPWLSDDRLYNFFRHMAEAGQDALLSKAAGKGFW